MQIDSTFEFEKRRNRPVKYNRELMGKTLAAMQRVKDIQTRREETFHENRMRDAKVIQKAQARVELEKDVELLVPAAVQQKEEVMRNIIDSAKARVAAKKKVGLKASNNSKMMEED